MNDSLGPIDPVPARAGDADAAKSEATLLSGRLRLKQLSGGHKAGTDAVLLAACTPASASGLVLDLGCGSGAVGLMAAVRAPAVRAVLIDNDPISLGLAQDNIGLNDLRARVEVQSADILDLQRGDLANLRGQADLVLTNPPFLDESQSRLSPDPRRRAAHVMPEGGLDRWLDTARRLARPNGRIVMIHRADALPLILRCPALALGSMTVLPVHARAGEPAIRVLVGIILGSKAPFRLASPLVLHESGGSFTPQADAIHRGRVGLEL